MTLIAAVLGNFCLNEHNALANILFQVQDVGGNVEVAWSGGTWNVTGLSGPVGGAGSTNYAQFGSTFDYFFEGGSSTSDTWTYTTTPSTVISGFVVSDTGTATSGSDRFRLFDNGGTWTVGLPSGYSSGSPLSGTATFPGTDVATLFQGNLSGSSPVQIFSDGTNTVSFQAVPEPSTYAMLFAGGMTAAGAAIRRRRRQAAPAS
jgi:hypothetical protein